MMPENKAELPKKPEFIINGKIGGVKLNDFTYTGALLNNKLQGINKISKENKLKHILSQNLI